MSTELSFIYETGKIRVAVIDNEPWFVAKDVCDILELSEVSNSLKRLRGGEKLTRKIFVSGQNRETWFINEPGLYRLIFTSNKEEAERFQDWVYNEVLPSIRKTGKYESVDYQSVLAFLFNIKQITIT